MSRRKLEKIERHARSISQKMEPHIMDMLDAQASLNQIVQDVVAMKLWLVKNGHWPEKIQDDLLASPSFAASCTAAQRAAIDEAGKEFVLGDARICDGKLTILGMSAAGRDKIFDLGFATAPMIRLLCDPLEDGVQVVE